MDEARRCWFKAYASDTDRRTHHAAQLKPARPRSVGASGQFGHADVTESGWHWQSWRGWTTSSRHNHEQRMRGEWMREAQERWQKQNVAGLTWKLPSPSAEERLALEASLADTASGSPLASMPLTAR